jgi:hypothetical protein
MLKMCLVKTLPGNKTQWDKITLDEGKRVHDGQVGMLLDTPPDFNISFVSPKRGASLVASLKTFAE